jgi:hypothetical protein
MDVKSDFLNDDLAEEVYVTQPLDFISEGLTHSYTGWVSRNASQSMVSILE